MCWQAQPGGEARLINEIVKEEPVRTDRAGNTVLHRSRSPSLARGRDTVEGHVQGGPNSSGAVPRVRRPTREISAVASGHWVLSERLAASTVIKSRLYKCLLYGQAGLSLSLNTTLKEQYPGHVSVRPPIQNPENYAFCSETQRRRC